DVDDVVGLPIRKIFVGLIEENDSAKLGPVPGRTEILHLLEDGADAHLREDYLLLVGQRFDRMNPNA
ncbi:hypothetical protein, partial [Proteus mirabilis]|uniref:hypothetical protein n=1 Tax=Proteus mirabilis TaxID=584 RepID=UPI0013D27C52